MDRLNRPGPLTDADIQMVRETVGRMRIPSRDRDDVLQETMLRLLRTSARRPVRIGHALVTRIAWNAYYDSCRKGRREDQKKERLRQEPQPSGGAQVTTGNIDVADVIERHCSPLQSELVQERLAGHTLVEIAELKGMPLGTVQWHFHRIRQALQGPLSLYTD